jgi:exodeoxyribonuclease-5
MGSEAAPIQLTAEQQAAVELLKQAIATRGEAAILGPAGSGKTYTVRALLSGLGDGEVPLLVAPSHKARRVLEAGLEGIEGLRSTTVASLLRMGPAIDSTTGQIAFRRSATADPLLATALRSGPPPTLLLVDEVSMVPSHHADQIADVARQLGAALLWCGDPAQLPPPETGQLSPRFTNNPNTARLETVMRTGAGPILELSVAVRHARHPRVVWPTRSHQGGSSEVVVHPDRDAWLAAACKAISDPRWADDPDRARAVFWTHQNANSTAKAIRAQLYGADAERTWHPGEWLSAVRGLPPEGSALGAPVAPCCTELQILKVGTPEPLAIELGEFTRYTPKTHKARTVAIAAETTASRVLVLDRATGEEHELWLEPPATSGAWEGQVKKVRSLVREHIHDHRERAKLLELVADLGTFCPWLRPAQTMTVHASQGSSFGEVFTGQDLSWCQQDVDRLAYVAITRAQHRLHVMPWVGGGWSS